MLSSRSLFSRFKMLSSHFRHLSFKMRTGGKNIAAHLNQVGVKPPIYWENKESGRKYFRTVEEHISLMCQPPYVCPNRKEGDWQKDDPEMCSTCQHVNVFLILVQKFHILGLVSFYQKKFSRIKFTPLANEPGGLLSFYTPQGHYFCSVAKVVWKGKT